MATVDPNWVVVFMLLAFILGLVIGIRLIGHISR